MQHIAENNERDLTYDAELIDYLRTGKLPVAPDSCKRV